MYFRAELIYIKNNNYKQLEVELPVNKSFVKHFWPLNTHTLCEVHKITCSKHQKKTKKTNKQTKKTRKQTNYKTTKVYI